MITVDDARALLFDLVPVLPVERVPLGRAAGRVLAGPVAARRDQPPFDASSMDGYAVKSAEAELHGMFRVIGESAAGHGFPGKVGAGQAVRIFTGAPMPEGADFVVIQEDITRRGDVITITDTPGHKTNVRPRGGDFRAGDSIDAPRLLRPADIALLAAMHVAQVPVRRRPVVALISTGDELVMPDDTPGADQITVSNTFGLAAMLGDAGAEVRILPIARDRTESLETALNLAQDADLIVTIGGASVGDHDLVGQVAQGAGLERSFYKIAMRPGKPLMAGRLGGSALVGLPGNPVSAMVCGHIFILPMLRVMAGFPPEAPILRRATLSEDLAENGPREHYMRAVRDGETIHAFNDQDSAMLGLLSRADALIRRPANDPARTRGEIVDYVAL
ncbi:gephyrin-like molybdotransferase Glp [Arenibacterium halophilum]|uniref:Molybdopterin molybdenumtransferase n=1 Tax=Arenibacterium halophilum TaxID=2583821 RepID=A0ABY2XBR7_9RHOB|nr:gephyrin-like molybdotransferase Glp [Arenibacterium halophilum]TMV14470.1 molybdopterin molybdotransferase MoeA [Arenibacterium halophilum]